MSTPHGRFAAAILLRVPFHCRILEWWICLLDENACCLPHLPAPTCVSREDPATVPLLMATHCTTPSAATIVLGKHTRQAWAWGVNLGRQMLEGLCWCRRSVRVSRRIQTTSTCTTSCGRARPRPSSGRPRLRWRPLQKRERQHPGRCQSLWTLPRGYATCSQSLTSARSALPVIRCPANLAMLAKGTVSDSVLRYQPQTTFGKHWSRLVGQSI